MFNWKNISIQLTNGEEFLFKFLITTRMYQRVFFYNKSVKTSKLEHRNFKNTEFKGVNEIFFS